jgi:putative transposase
MLVRTVKCKLRTHEVTRAALLETMITFNAACNALSAHAFREHVWRKYDLHHDCYHEIRAQFPSLPAQLVVRAIAVVTDSYKLDRSVQHVFGPHAAVVYDARCFRLKNLSSVLLTTTRGRHAFVMAHGGKQREWLASGEIGEADLLYQDGTFYLAITIKRPDPPAADTSGGVLGVDLGIVALAVDADGEAHSGTPVQAKRVKTQRIRSLLQAKGTKSAKRHLQKIARTQSRYVRDTNHCIAKHLVLKAITAEKALALENLTGIRARATGFSRDMRRRMGNWAFADLADKITYKAQDRGIPVYRVDPAYTSQTCSVCGHCERANRRSQAQFQCQRCGFELNADHNAAVNIGVRAAMSIGLLQPTFS